MDPTYRAYCAQHGYYQATLLWHNEKTGSFAYSQCLKCHKVEPTKTEEKSA